MATVKRFEDLEAWQTARVLTRMVYTLTSQGQFASDFGLRCQMQRASVSIMSNIAEGFESRTRSLFIDFLGRAKASAGELRAQMYIALDCGYITEQEFSQLFEIGDKCIRQLVRFSQDISHRPKAVHDEGIVYNV